MEKSTTAYNTVNVNSIVEVREDYNCNNNEIINLAIKAQPRGRRLVNFWRILLEFMRVEPILLLHGIGQSSTIVIVQNFYINRICTVSHNITEDICANLTNFPNTEKLVESTASMYTMYQSLIENGFPVLVALFLAPWSDKYGKKYVILLPLLGYTISCCLYTLFYFLPHLPPGFLLLCSTPVALTGGLLTVIVSTFSFMANQTTLAERSFRISVLGIIWNIGEPVGLILGAKIFKASGFFYVFLNGAVIYAVAIIYGAVMIREKKPETAIIYPNNNSNCCADMCDLAAVKDTVLTGFKSRAGHRRRFSCNNYCAAPLTGLETALSSVFPKKHIPIAAYIHIYTDHLPNLGEKPLGVVNKPMHPKVEMIVMPLKTSEIICIVGRCYMVLASRRILLLTLCLCLQYLSWSGVYNYKYMFTRNMFEWGIQTYTLYATINSSIGILGGIVLTAGIKALAINDEIVGIFGCISNLSGYFIFALASSGWLMYLGSGIQMFGVLISCTIRSMLSKCVSDDEVAKLLCFATCAELAMPFVAGPLFSLVFLKTEFYFAGAIFVFAAALNIVILLSFLYLIFYMRTIGAYSPIDNNEENEQRG